MKTKKWSPQPYLQIRATGPRLELRPHKISDFKKLRESQSSRLPPTNRHDEPIPTASETHIKKFKQRLQRHRKLGAQGHHFIFGIFDKKTGIYVGQIDVFTINRQLRWANLGYHIQNQYHGRGYASEASKIALKIAFRALDLHRIESSMELDNKASQKVARNCGMDFEGKRKKFFPNKGGIDLKVFAMNAIDFRKKSR